MQDAMTYVLCRIAHGVTPLARQPQCRSETRPDHDWMNEAYAGLEINSSGIPLPDLPKPDRERRHGWPAFEGRIPLAVMQDPEAR